VSIPDPHVAAQEAIERAKRLGTFDKIDRRIQYQGPDRAQPEVLLQAVNALGNHTRAQQSSIDILRSELETAKRKLRWAKAKNTIYIAIIGGASAKGIEVAVLAILKALGR
jgi:hypothetical protein